MDLYPTDEQRELAEAAWAVLARDASGAASVDDQCWDAGVTQGWLALGLDETSGGIGGSLADEVQVYTEIGRAVADGPFLATSVAARVAAAAGANDLAEALATGRLRSAISFVGYKEGETPIALDTDGADVVLVVDEALPALQLLEFTDASARVKVQPLDPAGTAARLDLGSLPDLVRLDGMAAATELDRAAVKVAALLTGVARAAMDMSVSYARVREQFGRPIGSFQAVSHRCADMAIRFHAATAATNLAAVAHDEDAPEAGAYVASARRYAEGAALENARVNIQNHGAIGFTWEHDAHRLLKRARVLSLSVLPRSGQTAALVASGRKEEVDDTRVS